MRDHLHKALKPIKDKSGLWWLFFWKWPELLRECHGEINQLTSDLSMVREKFRNEQSRCEAFEKLANESREMAAAAANRASAEKSLSQNLSEELGYAKVQLQKSSETAAGLENKVTRMEMEMERVKAELAKTQADLTRSGLELERERRIQQDTRRDLTLLREFVHRTHRLDIPTRRGVKAMLANGSRLIAFLALLLPMVLLSAPFPPPFFRGVYTTNTAAWANTNVVSLSTTNATSKPLTNHYQDGVLTLYGLEAGANITLTVNPSNIVITGAAGGGDAGGTNARQFGTLTLTNLSGTGAVTNVVSLSTTNATSKPITNHFENGILTIYGLEAGANITLSDNGSNIVITGSAGGGGLTTNANQFLGVPLSIKTGAFQTNFNGWGSFTNQLGDMYLSSDGSIYINGLRSLNNGGSADLFVGEPAYESVQLQAAGRTVAFQLLDNYVYPVPGDQIGLGFSAAHWNDFNANFGHFGGAITNVTLQATNMPGSSLDLFRAVATNGASFRVNSNGMVIIQSSNLLPALIVTNHAGPTVDLVTMLTTNGAGLRVTSNGAVVVRGVIGSTTNSFEVRRSNNVVVPLAVTHSNTVRIVGPSQSGYGATLTIGSEDGSTQNNIELFTGNTLSGRWRSDNVGNQIISAEGSAGELYFQYDGANSGLVRFGFPGVGDMWRLINSSAVSAWHGQTARRGQISNVWDVYVRSNVNWTEVGGSDRVFLQSTSGMSSYTMFLPITNGLAGQVLYNVGGGELSWKDDATGGGAGLTTNANQFGESVELTIKSGALLTNTLFYPSNLTGPAIIATATTAQVTNLVEWLSTNGTINVSISSNANAIVYGRLDMSNAVAFRTNNIDFRLPVYQAFTNSLQTNLVLQLTNVYEGVTHRIDAYGSGRLGGGRTNAWQILCTVAANRFIYWPPGTTNGNFDVLVNSNQIVSFTFMGGLGSTNILASYRVLEGIGVN